MTARLSQSMDIMLIAQPLRSRLWAAYALAVLLALVAIGARVLCHDALQSFPYVLPLFAVTLAAFMGGAGPATLTAVLCQLDVQYYVVPPTHTWALTWPNGYIGLAFYAFLCFVIILLMHGMFAAHGALQASETSLQRLNEDLEARVAERTLYLSLAQDELVEANRTLERRVEARVADVRVANEEIQRFAYIVSHDLRAPLVNVLGFTSEIDSLRVDLGDFLDEVQKVAPQLATPDRRLAIETDLPEALGFIRSSTTKMDRLINAILKLSRQGQRKLTPEEIDIAALVKAQADSLSHQLTARDAEIVVEGALPDLVSDRLAIDQIFGNLIENAVKYLTDARPGRIVVSGKAEGATVRYDIADNGRGIDARDFGRIFDLFRRSGEQDTQGEGIGLAYVRNLVRRLDGHVTVRSEFGVGSTFTVTLPATLRSAVEGKDMLEAV